MALRLGGRHLPQLRPVSAAPHRMRTEVCAARACVAALGSGAGAGRAVPCAGHCLHEQHWAIPMAQHAAWLPHTRLLHVPLPGAGSTSRSSAARVRSTLHCTRCQVRARALVAWPAAYTTGLSGAAATVAYTFSITAARPLLPPTLACMLPATLLLCSVAADGSGRPLRQEPWRVSRAGLS